MSERFRWVWLLVTVVMGVGVLAYSGILYTDRVQRESREEILRVEREAQADFCEMMRVFYDPLGPQPTTERGRRQVDAIRTYLLRRC